MRLLKSAAPLFAAAVLALSTNLPAQAASPDNTLVLTLKQGDVVIALEPELAPKHVAQIKNLVAKGEYDNVAFHRVIEGFMAQTGDVRYGDMKDGYDAARVGTGGSDLPDLPAEFSNEHFRRGTVGMARSADPDSANSQFFIMFAPAASLDGQYTIVGQVESGMKYVDAIKKGDQADNGKVDQPDVILDAHMASDKK